MIKSNKTIRICILIAKLFCARTQYILRDKRAESYFPTVTVTEIGKTIYKIAGHFKENTTVTVSDKIFRLMEKELAIQENLCYNQIDTNTQKSLDVSRERSGI